MGDPRLLKKKYDKPKHPWSARNIFQEKELKKTYGLKNKKEIWRAKTQVRNYRHLAREIVGLHEEEKEQKEGKLLEKLQKIGLIRKTADLDDVLSLKVEDLLERRLQTQAWRKGLGKTPNQSRQLIIHGHIKVNGRRVNTPGKIITKDEEDKIDWYKGPVANAKAEATPREVEEPKEKKPKKKPKKKKEPKKEKKEEPKKKQEKKPEEKKEEGVKCPICEKEFSSTRGMKIHKTQMHGKGDEE